MYVFAFVAALCLAGGTAAMAANKSASGPSAPAAPGSVVGYQYVQSASIANPNNSQNFGSVFCPSGRPVTGGGGFGSSGNTGQDINSTFPIDGADADAVSDDGWGIWMNNSTGAASSFTVWAICRIPQVVT
jgi:hypothetical protein